MKKILLIVVLCILVAAFIIVFFINKNNNKVKSIKSLKKLEYSIHDGRRINGDVVYKIICDDTCTLINKPEGYPEDKTISAELDEDTMEEIIDMLNYYNVASWNGFNKSDKTVLDGTDFDFNIVTKNDEKISASGYMKFPRNYSEVVGKLINIFKRTLDKSCISLFDHEYYKNLKLEDVVKVEIDEITEACINKKTITDKKEIKELYNKWDIIKLTIECEMTCDDNTTIYHFGYF